MTSTDAPTPSQPPVDPAASAPRPPRPAHRPTDRTHHGDTVSDPFEWLRVKEDPEVIAHLEAENAFADARTAHLSGLRSDLVSEFVGHTQETDQSVPVRRGDWWYLTRTTEGEDYPRHTRVAETPELPRGAGGVPAVEPGVLLPGEQVILDAQSLAEGREFFSLGGMRPSPSQDLLAFSTDVRGDERFDVVVTDLRRGSADGTGSAGGEVIDEAVRGAGYGLAFSTDEQWLFYARVDDAWRQHQIWRHRLGTDAQEDQLVLEETDERFSIGFGTSRDGSTLIIEAASTTTSEGWLLDLSDPTSAPRSAGGRRPGIEYSLEPAGDHLLVVHNDGAPGFALATASLEDPGSWTTILEAADGERLESVDAFAGFAALELRSGGLAAVRVIPRRGATGAGTGSNAEAGAGADVDGDTAAHAWAVEDAWDVSHGGELDTVFLQANHQFDEQLLRYQLTSLLTPSTIAQVDVRTREHEVLRRTPVPGYDPELYVEKRLWARAADGTSIPISLAARREVAPDATNPGYLYGYGSYEASMDPSFVPTRLSLLDRGVVVAVAHVRGGGEMGRPWYEHGKLLEKRNTFTDFVDCAAHLVDAGWVAPDRLSAEGRSAGGLLMGAIANLAPERFRAIIAGVPFVDALTTILDPSLPLTVGEWEEWGDPLHDPEVYAYMKSYSPYENVREVEYPAIFASTSLNDTRVFFVEPAKWVARLRETVTSDQDERPIVFRCEMVAGHGGRSGRYAKWEQRADELAWLLDQIGATARI
ncbi:S9 family peptidase [Brachybacterium sp. ACRRE]|uniref:S9 family peptidase n=1 Tax=Brachybacterium sp. ACRRE TaxID=2918184 RepID=UPI001EF376D5|nr:S9 family peptidase [Brachybacterium sp. ACRRE]MCG7309360.1 S9 family peptidase [Brachybacterium sp. ACRRE]